MLAAARLGVLRRAVPAPVLDSYLELMAARAVMAGASLGVFRALAEEPADAGALAERLGLDATGAEALLEALAAVGYVRQRAGIFHNAKHVERFLLPGSGRSVEAWVGGYTYDVWDAFSQLERVLKDGRPLGLYDRPADDPMWERHFTGLRDLARFTAEAVARTIGARSPRRLLDIGGGHGAFSIAMCRRHPELQATIVELEPAARVGRRIVAEEKLDDRIRFETGDAFSLELGVGYDVVTAHSILHNLDRDAGVELLRRARAALRDGGKLAVLELERPEPGETGTRIATLAALLFFLLSHTRTYTAGELRALFVDAGFARAAVKRPPRLLGQVLVVAER